MNKSLRVAGIDSVHLPRFTNNGSKSVLAQEADEDAISPRRSKQSQRSHALKCNTFPSPASGISDECLAMANACNHDHDYVVLPLCKNKEVDCEDANETSHVLSSESMPNIKNEFAPGKTTLVPKPPTILYANNSHQDKIIRRQSLRRGAKANSQITKLFFTSDSKTTYRPTRPKTSANHLKTIQVLPDSSANKKTELMSKNISNNNNKQKIIKDDVFVSDDDICIPNHSTPNSNVFLSPRMSITPMPPTDQRKHSRSFRGPSRRHIHNPALLESDDESSDVNISNDSAYSSLSCSASSHPRTPSAGRPQSGDKRSATSNLSSSSSFSSTDEESDHERMIEAGKTTVEKLHNRCSVEKDNHIPKIITKKGHKKVVKQEDVFADENYLCESQKFVPVPPKHKPKKGGRLHEPLPMRMRALPTSFWQEPNKMNAVPYSVLPPVFKQTDVDDIADILPITLPNEETSKKILPPRHLNNAIGRKVVITTGDTDLLLRLFDKVEAKKKPSQGTRAKRGRPRRAPRCAFPPPRIPHNEDPCIIDSITDKLFPKLSLEHRNSKPLKARTVEEKDCDDGFDYAEVEEATHFSSEYQEFTTDYSIEDTFKDFNDIDELLDSNPQPNITTQRSISVSLPQLTNTGPDFSHILSELAAGL